MPIEWLMYPVLGVIAGILAGLLGVGGGLVLVVALAWLLPLQGVPLPMAMHAALATSLASIVITAAASARAHHRRGSVLWPTVAWLLPGLLVGGWLGSGIATHLSGDVLRHGVIAYCVLAALQLLLDWPRSVARADGVASPRGVGLSVAGVVIGGVSALVGIGGGSMTVPVLIWRGVVPVRAVGTSSACGIGIGLASASGYALQANVSGMPVGSWGYVFLPAAIGIAVTSLIAAPYGARLAHHFSGVTLKRVFATFLLLVATSLALAAPA
ncbi:MAG TPA: sulfite exporter TauE/SafE family protein [Arenimonas sp.]|uniref:sulfite exporter TauE/SafE family protein n=1 Tax=Arenimonas sp. TaxID=1872635 RepID=UPI002C61AB98|nr:sulfite exporter TauE/SafE family protein [Arenimonas sp.]HMB57598.1 sulfite exporter TauE/SafE family protein [Arenimonas sp.]